MKILDKIHTPEDLKILSFEELTTLCGEIREFLVENVSQTGGHLASNLGSVELMVAIHNVFDTTEDRLVFDVGHQSYVHKILTGRKEEFSSLRKLGGISGFPHPGESIHDAFIAGHASNSISVALGLARGRTLAGKNHHVLALLGDGALTGGLSYEGLSDAGDSHLPLIVILNDNGMSISGNVGGMASYLSKQRMKQGYITFKKYYRRFMKKIPGGKAVYRFTHRLKNAIKRAVLQGSIFENMGFQYVGPVDGHDIKQLSYVLSKAEEAENPVLVHVTTKKGKGYLPAEQNPDAFHGVSGFNPQTGELPPSKESFSSVFGKTLCELAGEYPKVCAITAAMSTGTGLVEFSERYPNRFFDVGIAEGHGVTMAAGMAAGGQIPVFAVYSSFLQRGYDMLMHDVSILGEHVVFGIDRSGIVGSDGVTHNGVFDVSYLTSVPGMKVYSPASFRELSDMLREAVLCDSGPVAVRYPRGGEGRYQDGGCETVKQMSHGADFTLVTYGISVNDALRCAEILEKDDIHIDMIKLGVICPLDTAIIDESVKKTGRVLVLEECIRSGSVGEKLGSHFAECGIPVKTLLLKNLGDGLVTHGSPEQLRKIYGLDAESLADLIRENLV